MNLLPAQAALDSPPLGLQRTQARWAPYRALRGSEPHGGSDRAEDAGEATGAAERRVGRRLGFVSLRGVAGGHPLAAALGSSAENLHREQARPRPTRPEGEPCNEARRGGTLAPKW